MEEGSLDTEGDYDDIDDLLPDTSSDEEEAHTNSAEEATRMEQEEEIDNDGNSSTKF